MILKFSLLSVLIILALSCQSQDCKPCIRVNWNDSISVHKSIDELSLCQEIELVSDSLDVFVRLQGHSALLLRSISKQTKKDIHIPIGMSGVVVSDEYRLFSLQEQLDEIRKQFCNKL